MDPEPVCCLLWLGTYLCRTLGRGWGLSETLLVTQALPDVRAQASPPLLSTPFLPCLVLGGFWSSPRC